MSVLQRKPYSPSKEIIDYLKKNHPTKETWVFHRVRDKYAEDEFGGPIFSTDPPKPGETIRNYKVTRDKRGTLTGYTYEKRTWVGPKSNNDWMLLIQKNSRGLTPLGQKMFQQSLESFVFSILDAQAKTGWTIVGQGAKSYQTQDVFRKLVQDTIMQNDVNITISNMKRAIIDTGVSLNFAIIPNVILIPSDLRLQQKIPGFNNILTMANFSMHFGKNNDVNSRDKRPIKDTSHHQEIRSEDTSHHQEISSEDTGGENQQKNNNLFYSGKKDTIQTENESESSIEITIIGGVTAGLLLRLILWLF